MPAGFARGVSPRADRAGRAAGERSCARARDRRRADRRRRARPPVARAPRDLQRPQPRVRLPPRARRAARNGEARARCARSSGESSNARRESWMVSEPTCAPRASCAPPRACGTCRTSLDVAAIVPRAAARARAARDLRGQLRLPAQPRRPALPARGGPPAGVGRAARRAARSGRGRLGGAAHPGRAGGRGLVAALEDPRVEALGFVEDLPAAYARARCAVVPLLQGGGTPLKLIEALAYGLPVVATPRAAAGLAVRDGEHCLIAGDRRRVRRRARPRAARRRLRAGPPRTRARRGALLDRGAQRAAGGVSAKKSGTPSATAKRAAQAGQRSASALSSSSP